MHNEVKFTQMLYIYLYPACLFCIQFKINTHVLQFLHRHVNIDMAFCTLYLNDCQTNSVYVENFIMLYLGTNTVWTREVPQIDKCPLKRSVNILVMLYWRWSKHVSLCISAAEAPGKKSAPLLADPRYHAQPTPFGGQYA